MKKIIQFIVTIPHDKLLHIMAGFIIAMSVLRIIAFTDISGFLARAIALLVVIVAGILREIYNKNHGGVFDKKDLFATIFGGLVVTLLTVY